MDGLSDVFVGVETLRRLLVKHPNRVFSAETYPLHDVAAGDTVQACCIAAQPWELDHIVLLGFSLTWWQRGACRFFGFEDTDFDALLGSARQAGCSLLGDMKQWHPADECLCGCSYSILDARYRSYELLRHPRLGHVRLCPNGLCSGRAKGERTLHVGMVTAHCQACGEIIRVEHLDVEEAHPCSARPATVGTLRKTALPFCSMTM